MAINLRQEITIKTDEYQTHKYPTGGKQSFYEAFWKNIGYTPASFIQKFDGEITGGIGSSASTAVAIVGALWSLAGRKLNRTNIAESAWNIEVNELGMFGGKQDQYAAAYGGVNIMYFNGEVKVIPLYRELVERVADSILLFHTGENRKSKNIQDGFKEPSLQQIKILDKMKELVPQGCDAMYNGKIKRLGQLIDKTWQLKKKSNSGVSNEKIDKLFIKAKRLGAYGGKLLGAGGGGYCIFVVPISKQKQFKNKIGIKWVDYSIDWQGLDVRQC